ncbi:aspartate/glutamate racemase family protein [Thiotrichales bacterium 19S9-12]|nr:aspartate/glutamate racemase family protein [Thiotrichales bacterium 19S9-11]MCF6811893.1 aspartate/glutamate racemase family protein [Thiotrichales bacterium 19S9-12]
MSSILVVAGTAHDTQMGISLLSKYHYQSVGCPISETPYEQTQLQCAPEVLLKIVIDKINQVTKKHQLALSTVFLYCNSLSVAIDMQQLEKILAPATILSPLDVYQAIGEKYRHIGLLCANSQSAGRIEAKLYELSSTIEYINGLGCLDLVDAIEMQIAPEELIKKHSLLQQVEIFKQKGAEVIILGCTHFGYFANQLDMICHSKQVTLEIIDPGVEMVKLL